MGSPCSLRIPDSVNQTQARLLPKGAKLMLKKLNDLRLAKLFEPSADQEFELH
jgi:hypothetical protein